MDTALLPYGGELRDFAFLDVRLGTVDGGEQGLLVMRSNHLVAVLTQVDEQLYSVRGGWFLETGYGRLNGCHRVFESLDEATSWIAGHFRDDQDILDESKVYGVA